MCIKLFIYFSIIIIIFRICYKILEKYKVNIFKIIIYIQISKIINVNTPYI